TCLLMAQSFRSPPPERRCRMQVMRAPQPALSTNFTRPSSMTTLSPGATRPVTAPLNFLLLYASSASACGVSTATSPTFSRVTSTFPSFPGPRAERLLGVDAPLAVGAAAPPQAAQGAGGGAEAPQPPSGGRADRAGHVGVHE